METWKVCPQLITLNKECTRYIGYINTRQGHQFKIQIELAAKGRLKGARIKCEWQLQTLLKGYGHILTQRQNQASSLASFLEDLQSLIERRLDESHGTHTPSSFRFSSELLQQLEQLGWQRVVSVEPTFREFKLKAEDSRGRTHIIHVHLRPQGGLSRLFQQFEESLSKYQDFWDQVSEIDSKTWVLEPEKPGYSATHRRILLSTDVSLQLSINPELPRQLPECRFLGSDQAVRPFQESLNENLQTWDENVSLLTNLQRLVGQEFPSPATSNKEDFNLVCGICYSYRLDTAIPDKTCDDVRCGQPFHSGCLYEWLRSLTSSRQSFNEIFGECPYCSKPITVKMTC